MTREDLQYTFFFKIILYPLCNGPIFQHGQQRGFLFFMIMENYKGNNLTLFLNEPTARMNGFVQMPNKVLLAKGLNSNEKILYVLLIRLSGNRGYAFASNAYIANELNVSIRSVEDWIRKLKKLHFITATYIRQPGKKEIKQRFLTVNITVEGGNNELTDPRLDDDYDELSEQFKK